MYSKIHNKTCYLLACGPSIKNQDLTKIKDNPCVSISNFFVHDLFSKLNIKYHVFGARHNPITERMYLNWMLESSHKINPKTNILISDLDRKLFKENTIFTKHNVIFWSYLSKNKKFLFSILHKLSFVKSFNKLLSWLAVSKLPHLMIPSKGVAQIGLQICLHLALKEKINKIVILGIDHSWSKHVGTSKHFYEENQHSLVRDGYNEWFSTPTQEEEEINLKAINDLYLRYYTIAEELGVTILNGTPASMITSLPTEEL